MLYTVTPILSDLFHECYTTGHMTDEMRRAKVTLAFKGGELDATLWSTYRPIAVTEMVYRIMGRCVQLKVATMLPSLIGESQRGFIPGALIEDDVLAITEATHFCNTHDRTGLILLLDNMQKHMTEYASPS